MKEIKNIRKAMEKIELIVAFIKGGFQHYWNSFIESNLVIIKGYYGDVDEDDDSYYRGPVGYNGPEEIKLGLDESRTFYIQRILSFGDYVATEDLIEEEDDFIKFGFIYNDKVYVTSFNVVYNVYWEFLSRFLNILEPENNNDYDWYRFIPIRWLGAYNTGASVGKADFLKALDYETNACRREKAAQAVIDLEELKAICENSYYCNDSLKYSKVGVLYSTGDCREVHYQDVWSRNIGQYLVPGNEWDTSDTYENHLVNPYEGTLAYLALMLSEYTGYAKEQITESFDLLFDLNDLSIYNSSKNKEIFEDIMDMIGYNYEQIEEWVTKFHFAGDAYKRSMAASLHIKIRNIMDKIPYEVDYYGMYKGDTAYHNEGFVKVGAKPTAIVVRGRIKDSNYEIIKRMAKEKNLEVLHF